MKQEEEEMIEIHQLFTEKVYKEKSKVYKEKSR
jgi:hypothetical protein